MRLIISCILTCLVLIGVSFGQPALKPAIQTFGSSEPMSSAPLASLEPQIRTEKKSVLLAIGYSLILPGLGDLYADNFRTGRYYLGADAALWLTYGGLRTYGQWLRSDAQKYATHHAAANFDGKGDQFSVDIGNFDDVYQYNEAKLRNRQFDLMYDPNSNYAWQWNATQDRLDYKHLRVRGDAVIRNSQFVIGALVINRIISAISAARSAAAYNRSVQSLGTWRLRADVKGGVLATQNLELTLSREF